MRWHGRGSPPGRAHGASPRVTRLRARAGTTRSWPWRSRALSHVPPLWFTVEDEVLAAGDEARAREGERLAQVIDVEIADGRDALTDDLWRYAHGEAVDEVGVERGRDDSAAALDQERADPDAAQPAQQIREVDPAVRVGMRAQDLAARGVDRVRSRLRRRRSGRDDRARGPIGENVGREWDPQRAVDDHADRRAARREADREARVVGEHRADADHDRIVRGAKLMREAQRGFAADPMRVSVAGRDPSIDR